jgi:hypothetical protein
MERDDRHHQIQAARLRAELSVQDLWLAYVALGGTCDAFDVDGYLQGLVPLESFEQDVLAQAVNEGLADIYRAARVPLSPPEHGDGAVPGGLSKIVERLLEQSSQVADSCEEGATEDPS